MISITDGFSGGGGSTAVGIASKVDEYMTGNLNTGIAAGRYNNEYTLTQPAIRRRAKLTKELVESLAMIRRSDKDGQYGASRLTLEVRRSFQTLATIDAVFEQGGQLSTPMLDMELEPYPTSQIKGRYYSHTAFAIESYDDVGDAARRILTESVAPTYTECSIGGMKVTIGDSPTSGPVTAIPTSYSLYTATNDGVHAASYSKSFPNPFGLWKINESTVVRTPYSNTATGNLPAGYEIEYGVAVKIGDNWYGQVMGTHTVGVEGAATVAAIRNARLEHSSFGNDVYDVTMVAGAIYREKGQGGWNFDNRGTDIANPIPAGSFSVSIGNGINITAFQEIEIHFSTDNKAPNYAFCRQGNSLASFSTSWYDGRRDDGTNVRTSFRTIKFIGNPNSTAPSVSYKGNQFYKADPVSVNLSWVPVAGALGYKVFAKAVDGADTSGQWFKIYDGPANSFQWRGGIIDYEQPTSDNRTRNYPASHDSNVTMDVDEVILEPGDVIVGKMASNYDNVYYSLPVEFLE